MPGKKFPALLFNMVNSGFEECGWTSDGGAFWISNPERLASNVIPQFFGHSSYASLHRSLNSYDFHKATPSTWKHALFHRDRPEDIEKIQRKTLCGPQKSIKAQLEEERKQAAILQAKAQQLEEELRRMEEADRVAQQNLEKLQEKAAAATLDLNTKMAHPLTPSCVEPDIEEADQVEMELSLKDLGDVTLDDLGLSHHDLKPEAARIIDDELSTLFGNSCKVVSESLWQDFERAQTLTDEDARKVFDSLDTNKTGRITREDFQNVCIELWKLGPGSSAKCPRATEHLRKMFEALEMAAQVEPEYQPILLHRASSNNKGSGNSVLSPRRTQSSESDSSAPRGSAEIPFGAILPPLPPLGEAGSKVLVRHPSSSSSEELPLPLLGEAGSKVIVPSREVSRSSEPGACSRAQSAAQDAARSTPSPQAEAAEENTLEEESLSEESLKTGQFRFEEFRAMMHAWKDWHAWKEQGLSSKIKDDAFPARPPKDAAPKLFPAPTPRMA